MQLLGYLPSEGLHLHMAFMMKSYTTDQDGHHMKPKLQDIILEKVLQHVDRRDWLRPVQ